MGQPQWQPGSTITLAIWQSDHTFFEETHVFRSSNLTLEMFFDSNTVQIHCNLGRLRMQKILEGNKASPKFDGPHDPGQAQNSQHQQAA